MRQLIITSRAKLNIANLLDYLELRWNTKIKEKVAF